MSSRRTLRASRNATLQRLASRLDAELRRVARKPTDDEAIHDARVLARRLLAAGELWAAHVSPWANVRDRLPRFVKRLGQVRNLDIAIDLLKKGPKEDSSARKGLSRYFQKLRRKERARMVDWLEIRKIDRVRDAMRRVVREVKAKPVLNAPAPSDLAPHFARVMSLFTGRTWAPSSDESHAIRREVRRLRYAHETLEWAYAPGDFQKVVKVLRRIQEFAGEWQDRCVVEDLAAKAVRKGKVSVPLAGFLARLQSESKSLSERFVRAAMELAELRQKVLGEFQ